VTFERLPDPQEPPGLAQPELAQAELAQALEQYRAGRLALAADHGRRALDADPRWGDAADFLGMLYAELGQLEAAIAAWHQALTQDPERETTRFNYAIALHKAGHYPEAIAQYERLLALHPHGDSAAQWLLNLGAARRKMRDLAGAIACYRQVLSRDPNSLDARRNLGNALEAAGAVIESESLLREVVAQCPEDPRAHHSLGNTLWEQGRLEDAIACYDRALALDPTFAEARANRGMVYLLQGNFAAGWADYEARWQCVEIARGLPPVPFPQPLWQGSPLAGRTILLYADMGFGDAIQFVRYGPILANQGARVYVDAPGPLVRLFQTVAGVTQVIPRGEPLPEFDCWSPLMSLPHACGTRADSIPATIPYLSPPPEPFLLPIPAHPAPARRKLGLVWASGTTSATHHKRSAPLAAFAPIFAPGSASVFAPKSAPIFAPGSTPGGFPDRAPDRAPDWILYSLQKDITPTDRQQLRQWGGVDLSDRLTDFAATAAAIAQLDLVITVDTAVAHLAGALGKPVWIVVPWVCDWRWRLGCDRTPWYPTARLFRQPQLGDWDGAIAAVATALTQD
jgi:tetratricopeptide (TPR) repeat protein